MITDYIITLFLLEIIICKQVQILSIAHNNLDPFKKTRKQRKDQIYSFINLVKVHVFIDLWPKLTSRNWSSSSLRKQETSNSCFAFGPTEEKLCTPSASFFPFNPAEKGWSDVDSWTLHCNCQLVLKGKNKNWQWINWRAFSLKSTKNCKSVVLKWHHLPEQHHKH